MKTAAQWIDELRLERHPEGGWFRRVYESELKLGGDRPAMTSIYYLLEAGDFSALHRIQSDEQWHFYNGGPLTIHEIDSHGRTQSIVLAGQEFQHTVRAGTLFGATVYAGYALVGCTVVPGFDFAEFEMPSRSELLAEYPQHADLITRLTR